MGLRHKNCAEFIFILISLYLLLLFSWVRSNMLGGGEGELPSLSLILVFKYSFTCLNNFVLSLTKGNKVLLSYLCLESYLYV